MKRTCSTLFLTLLLSMVEINAWADESGSRTRTINVETAGTLRDLISEEERYSIEELTLTGEINGTDFAFLRSMAGKVRLGGGNGASCDYNNFHNTDGKLTSLDLSEAKIVAGGEYMEWDRFDNEVSYMLSNDNEIPPHVFHGCSRLTSIKIPESVNIIGSDAFAGTTWYDNQPDGLVYIGNVAYGYKGEMPANTKLTIKEGTLGIACSAFYNQTNLISIEIPNSVTAIGEIIEPKPLTYRCVISDGSFAGCTGLTSVNLPESVQFIGCYTFWGCTGLTAVTIPNCVTSIGEYAFENCSGLTSIIVQSGNTTYDSRGNCNAIINTETNSLIAGCMNTIIPNNVTSIMHRAFNGCSRLTSVTIPNSVTSIGDGAFNGCFGLTSVTIPNSVTSIGYGAFNGCFGLTSVTIPNSVASIGYGAFVNCSGLTSIIVQSGNTIYDSRDNCNAIIHTESNSLIAGCMNTIIPNSVTSIGDGAFKGCSGLTSITIPNSVTSISSAFGDCSNLASIYSLIETPADTYLYYAFGDTSRESIYNNCILYVPVGTISKYQACEGWKLFKNIVVIGTQISISKSGKTTLTSSQALDFSGFEDLKAYVATGYEEDGTIWLTRIKQVPAGTPVLIKGEADKTYEVPVLDKCVAYFENMFMGSADEDVIISATSSDGKYKNFYMSGGTFKPAPDNNTLKAGKCYLQVPANFNETKAGTDLKVKIAESGKSSYAPPVDIDLTNVEGLKAYAATGYDAASQTIWLTRINKIQAGEGVLLKGEANTIYTLPAAEVQAYYGNMFVGNIDSNITIGETSEDGKWTNYYLAGGSFKKVAGNRNISANKSYLHLPTSLLVSSARGKQAGIDEWLMEELETEMMLLGSIGGDEANSTTRIDAIGNESAQPDVYYNLQGQRIETPKMGIYIHNGRKVVIK